MHLFAGMLANNITSYIIYIGASILESLRLENPTIKTITVSGWALRPEQNFRILTELHDFLHSTSPYTKNNVEKTRANGNGTYQNFTMVKNIIVLSPANSFLGGVIRQNSHYHRRTEQNDTYEEYFERFGQFLHALREITKYDEGLILLPPLPRRLVRDKYLQCQQCIFYPQGTKQISKYMRQIKSHLTETLNLKVYHWWEILVFIGYISKKEVDYNVIDKLMCDWLSFDGVHLKPNGKRELGSILYTYAEKKLEE